MSQAYNAGYVTLQKPGKLQAIVILTLVDGILSILWGAGAAIGIVIGTLGLGIICVPFLIYPVVEGILAIIYAVQLLSEPPRVQKPAQYVAIMQIVNILFGNVISLVAGILALVFYSDYEVKAYFAALQQQQQPPQPQI